ncbi:nitroreductase/quinone reductase family protein [Planobispora takensis]|uniref:Cation-binding protein n=1 Tax=Planobispora takensis TaxID=1367882 RepID=A0A8J3T6Q7_9ACTN|nr:nitroreductase/quinone reductase family protein [Planobispora takensis]GII05416.1 cation-binding protein [Planobispora takensis]
MPNDFNQQVIDEFRANGGRVGGYFEGSRLLLLTTTGARSGAPHTVPLGYLPDGGERVLVIASAGGAPKDPAWFHNVVANPEVTVEDGVFTYQARAVVLRGGERDRVFARAVEADPAWGDYETRAGRALPVVALHQIAGGPPSATSWGAALKLIHGAFRRELALIRKEVAEAGPGLGAQLRVNCLTLCQGLHNHHTGEDTMMFPSLGEGRPDLAPILERLGREHEQIAARLDELQKILSAETADSSTLLPEVERLIDELERHLDYEEEQLIPILDGHA